MPPGATERSKSMKGVTRPTHPRVDTMQAVREELHEPLLLLLREHLPLEDRVRIPLLPPLQAAEPHASRGLDVPAAGAQETPQRMVVCVCVLCSISLHASAPALTVLCRVPRARFPLQEPQQERDLFILSSEGVDDELSEGRCIAPAPPARQALTFNSSKCEQR